MKKSITVELPEIVEELTLPNGWFSLYHIKSQYSTNGLYKHLKRLEQEGIIESKMGKIKTNGYIKNVALFRKI